METPPERPEEQRQNRSRGPGYDPTNELWEYINPDGTPEEEMVARVAEAIVSALDPEEIILFGSAARGEMHEHSDLDLLVVKTGCEADRRQTTGWLYGKLPARRRAVDIILVSPAEVELNRNKLYFVVGQALADGRTIYERRRPH